LYKGKPPPTPPKEGSSKFGKGGEYFAKRSFLILRKIINGDMQ